jgi:hypothetical protein
MTGTAEPRERAAHHAERAERLLKSWWISSHVKGQLHATLAVYPRPKTRRSARSPQFAARRRGQEAAAGLVAVTPALAWFRRRCGMGLRCRSCLARHVGGYPPDDVARRGGSLGVYRRHVEELEERTP